MSNVVKTISISTVEASKIIGVTDRMVRKYIIRGVLPAHAIKKHFRYSYRIGVEQLRDFAASYGKRFDEEALNVVLTNENKRIYRPTEVIFVS